MLLAALAAVGGCGGADRVFERDGALWRADGAGGKASRLADVGGFAKVLSEQGVCYVFFDLGRETAPLRVLQCSADGTIVASRLLARDGWEAANAILRVTWLRDNRIFVDTHVNPSLGFGVEIDLDSGASNVYAGTTFAWDPDARRVAVLREPPHFGSPPDVPSKLMVGHEEICDVPHRNSSGTPGATR